MIKNAGDRAKAIMDAGKANYSDRINDGQKQLRASIIFAHFQRVNKKRRGN